MALDDGSRAATTPGDDQALPGRRSVNERAAARLRDLDLAEDSLGAYARSGSRVDQLRASFLDEIGYLRGLLRELADESPKVPLQQAWDSLQRADTRSKALNRELMASMAGDLLRDQIEGAETSASETFKIADALLLELREAVSVPWDRFTIPAEREYTALDSGIVHLVFPRLTVWDLPAAVHEFGHYAARQIKVGDIAPFLSMRNSPALGSASHLEELFGDVFASFVAGPAYACMCVLLQFSPAGDEAVKDTDSHPAHVARVEIMLATLEAESARVHDPQWNWVVSLLRSTWRSNLETCGKPVTLPDNWSVLEPQILRRLQDDVLKHRIGAAYAGWPQAVALAGRLDPDSGVELETTQDGTSIRDILNAGWLARLWWPEKTVRIERVVRRLLVDATERRRKLERTRR